MELFFLAVTSAVIEPDVNRSAVSKKKSAYLKEKGDRFYMAEKKSG